MSYRLRIVGHSAFSAEESSLATARARAQLLSYSIWSGRTRPVDIVDEHGLVVETVRPVPTKEELAELNREEGGP